ncbi:MAG: transglutaminase-like domain-containing protein [Oscillospiraceae bacterium]|nr:transglutaminase-like domain-containing protein [Oscillospiraceae bacterium]
MKQPNKTAAFLITILTLILSVTLPVAAKPAKPAQIQIKFCETSEELSEYILQLVAQREEYISVAVPRSLAEADMTANELLRRILRQDNGYNRWNHKGGTVKKTIKSEHVIFEYKLTYRITQPQDAAARKLASGVIEKWDLKNLSDREKIGMVKTHISANWRYDETLANMNAYYTMTKKTGTCLGLTMATQLLLDEMGIQSHTVHGKLAKTGVVHIRLLVKLDNLWYTLDPTPLASGNPDLSAYLKQEHGKEFIPDDEYLTDEFRNSHPMTPGDKDKNRS